MTKLKFIAQLEHVLGSGATPQERRRAWAARQILGDIETKDIPKGWYKDKPKGI